MKKIRNTEQTRLIYERTSDQVHLLATFTDIKYNCSRTFLKHNENAR